MPNFVKQTGLAVPLDRANVDTDQIMPKQFLKRIERTGFGPFTFWDWRYLADGAPNPEFVLNLPQYQGASVLITGRNFGCGSSREHAPWGLADMGFQAIIAPSFADIFYNNCFKNFMLPVVLPEEQVYELMHRAKTIHGYQVTIDLEAQQVRDENGFVNGFAVDGFRRHCLLNGLDEIGLTLQALGAIEAYEVELPSYRR
ncbi:MAG TPA: 3-isopropylmalate dehydratase small subunit [Symbiobacteriaceae bacterium]|nr:3-isopropylmalate dehydratase small subunit [Symbiobacteriaceae bacterium]